MHLRLAGLLHHHRDRGFEVFDAAGDVGIVAGAARMAVAVVVHGPDVVAVAGEHVHERVFALARHRRGRRRSAWSSRSRARGTAPAAAARPARRADALAPQVELHVPFWPSIRRSRPAHRPPGAAAPVVCACALGEAGHEPGPDAGAGALQDGAARDRVVGGLELSVMASSSSCSRSAGPVCRRRPSRMRSASSRAYAARAAIRSQRGRQTSPYGPASGRPAERTIPAARAGARSSELVARPRRSPIACSMSARPLAAPRIGNRASQRRYEQMPEPSLASPD